MRDLALGILKNEKVNSVFFRIDFDASGMEAPVPGQFVNVRVADADAALLRRPISVFDFNGEKLSLLYRVVGKGTELLSKQSPGCRLPVLGPLGSAFPLPQGPAILVGGGVGIPPVHFFGQSLSGIPVTSCIGFRSGDEILLEESFAAFSDRVLVATDDGSAGVRGNVIDALNTLEEPLPDTTVYACGPEPMLRGLKTWCGERRLKLYVSMEAYMGCGFGVCLSCAVKHKSGTYVRACTEGPVFDAEEIEI